MTVLRYIQPRIKAMSNGLFANWMPTNQVEVGDFGVVRHHQFERLGSLRDYGATFDVEDGPASRNDIEYKDRFVVNVRAAGDAAATGAGDAKITVAARGRGSFLYHLSGVRQRRPANAREFGQAVARVLLGDDISFPSDGVIITEVQVARKATIIVSDRDDGQLEIKAAFKPAGDAWLSGAGGSLSTGSDQGSFFKWLAQDEMTPLIKIVIPKLDPVGGPGPGGGAGAGAGLFRRVKDWMQERRIGTSRLRISYRADPEGVVIGFADEPMAFTLALEDMSVSAMSETAGPAIEPAEPAEMEIEEAHFGAAANGRVYRQASG